MISRYVAFTTPPEDSTPCMLTIDPIPTQLLLAPPVHWPCGSSHGVVDVIAAVMDPRTDDCNVMLVPLNAVIAPVKSSIFAKFPLATPTGTLDVAVITPLCVTSIPTTLFEVTTALL